MKFSKYVHFIDLKNGSRVLFNSVNKQHLIIDSDFPLDSHSNPDIFSTDDFVWLKENLFILEDHEDEKESLLENFRYSMQMTDDVLHVVVHLNYDCNLKCGYCYQNVTDKKMVMSEVNQIAIIGFIKKLILEKNPSYVDLNFIGGEPTLHLASMKKIMLEINKVRKNSLDYSIVTNGTFGNKSKIEELLNLGLKKYFITLDGSHKIHDKFRKGASGRGSFDTIMKNLKMMKESFPDLSVTLNCNLNNDNLSSVPELLDELKKEKITYPLVFSDVIDTAKAKFSASITENDSHWYNVHKLALAKGYNYLPFYRDIYLNCIRDTSNYFVVGADGYLYSCIDAVGLDSYRQTYVSMYGTEFFDLVRSQVIDSPDYSAECAECEFYANCSGGCYYRKTDAGFRCPRESFLDNELPLIKMIFLGETSYAKVD